MPTPLQKKTAEAIVNIFETDSVRGDYGNVTLIKGDTGHLTFGRSQTTLGSGNLYRLIQSYIAAPGARFGDDLKPFVQRVEGRDFSLDTDAYLKNILRASADDAVMRDVRMCFLIRLIGKPPRMLLRPWGSLHRSVLPWFMTVLCMVRLI